MKKLLVALSLIAVLALAGSAYAVTTGSCTINLYGMDNMLAPSVIPFDPQPLWFDDLGLHGACVDWTQLYDGSNDMLYKYDATFQNVLTWNDNWPIGQAAFLAGEAYKFYVDGFVPYGSPDIQRTFSMNGVDISDTDLYVSLPGLDASVAVPEAPWEHWVGINYPADTTVPWVNVVVTNGSESWTMLDIYMGNGGAGWMDYNFWGLDAPSQNAVRVPDDGVETLTGGQGYQVFTNVRNLALIIPHPAS